ncbi:MAG: hypothetical protein CTY16_00865 [Methylobacter sp.]|nr:MAG: hypothetical protein CTY16_00865 [Methylobacter sp.]
MLDAILMDALAEVFPRELKEEDNNKFDYIYQTIRTSYETWLDSIQIELSSRWQRVDLALSAISAFVIALIFVLGSGVSWKFILIFILVSMALLIAAINFRENTELFLSIIFAALIILFFLSGALSWITVSFIIPVLMVPQARVLVERVLRIR